MDCHRQLGCSEEELHTRLSQLLDEELPGAQAEALEEHLKECARCREEVSELRGIDRQVSHAVGRTSASARFVGRVMDAIRGRPGSGRAGARPVPRTLVGVLVALALAGAGVVLFVVVRSLTAEPEPLKPVDLSIALPADGAGAPVWRERRIDGGPWVTKAPGEALNAATVLELAAPAGTRRPAASGAVERPDGLRLYAAAGTTVELSKDATAEHGVTLVEGRLLLAVPEGARGFQLGLPGGATVTFLESPSRILVECGGAKASVAVVAGAAGLYGKGPATKLPARASARVVSGAVESTTHGVDLRALDLEFAPPGLRVSAWAQTGGTSSRGGGTPFDVVAPPGEVLRLPDTPGGSGTVLGPDGTAYFLVGPSPGKLIGVRGGVRGGARGDAGGWEVAFSAGLESPFKGDPAVAPDGSVLVATNAGIVRVRPSAEEPVKGEGAGYLVRFGPNEMPRAGPCVGPAGGVCVVTSTGLASYGPDGRPRWRRADIARASLPSIGPDGTVFVATISGRLHALDPGTGKDREPRVAPVDEPFLSHVTVAPDGTAYAVSSSRYLVWRAPSGRSGRVTLPPGQYVLPPAVTPAGRVILVSAAGLVYRLEPRAEGPPAHEGQVPSNGSYLSWKAFFDAAERIARRSPVVADREGRLVIWTAAGRLVVIEPTGRSHPYDVRARGSFPAAVSREGALIFVTADGRVFGGKR